MSKSEIFWDRRAENYERKLNDHYLQVIERIKIHLSSDDVVLDYGCATGLVSHKLAAEVREIHGMDISMNMVKIASSIANIMGIRNAYFSQGTIFDDRLQSGSYDVILAINVLHLLEDPQSALSRMNELLKPGGLLISMTHCLPEGKSYLNTVQSLIRKLGLVPHVRMPKITALQNLITRGDFHIMETYNFSDSPPFAYYVVAKK